MVCRTLVAGVLLGIGMPGWTVAVEPAARGQAEAIYAATGIGGGVVVHLGCGDGRLTAALAGGGPYVVHGLTRDPAEAAKARSHILSQGLYGPVSVMHWQGDSLPYVDHLVNLLVVEDPEPSPRTR